MPKSDEMAARGYSIDAAIEAFQAAILPALQRATCFVSFSGGRDSSAVLAVATSLARRHGLPDPVPVTEFYPGVEEADESEWQHLVISHLGLSEWVRVEFPDGNDLLGEQARDSLQRRGMLWPPALHVKPAVLAELDGGGALLTGEGGDEVLGRRRGAQVSRLWRRPLRAMRPRDLRSAASTLAPRAYRERRVRAALEADQMQPWLLPQAASRHLALIAEDLASEPLATRASLEWLLTRRASAMASHNYSVLAREHGLTLVEPLLDPTFVRTLAAAAGTWGFDSRTQVMRALFGGVLPEEIVARRSKAYFNRAFVGEDTRAFAEEWDGGGVEREWVDPEILRDEWLSEFPSAISTPLLHAAWLHTHASSAAATSGRDTQEAT